MDPRTHDLVDLILDYSLEINPEDTLLVRYETAFSDVGDLLVKGAADRGAISLREPKDIEEEIGWISRRDRKELEEVSKEKCSLIEQSTACVFVYAYEDPDYLKDIPGENNALYSEIVKGPFLERMAGNGKEWPGVKWNLFGYPYEAQAKSMGLDFDTYSDFVFNSILGIDWNDVGNRMRDAKKVLDGAKDVHILVPGKTDFHLSLEERGAKICNGKKNMPDGEFFYGPVEGSARGHITFPYKANYQGVIVENVRLEFNDDGRIYLDTVTSDVGYDSLVKILSNDGADMPGELGIGCNYGITRPSGNTLFDEKMDGTIHVAMGDSFKEDFSDGGGLNSSPVHWDMICELRPVNGNPGGEIYVDDKLVQKNGIWTF
ncbi:aminopeptidase [Candidatus Woesearchaeota archaeon]|nr:aminopeptidase [Candidatus Woesearchaeota archaeon]